MNQKMALITPVERDISFLDTVLIDNKYIRPDEQDKLTFVKALLILDKEIHNRPDRNISK
jgi:hypothetical protein